MTKLTQAQEEHYKRAKDILSKSSEKGRSYIRGSLIVKSDGPLSNKLRELLNVNIKKTKVSTKGQKKGTAKTRTGGNVGKAKGQPKQS